MKKQNRSIIILGNGPSLREFDFHSLEGYDTIGMNVAFRHWHRINWYPTYYTCLDTVMIETHNNSINDLITNYNDKIKLFFIRKNILRFYPELKNNAHVIFFDDYFNSPYFHGICDVLTTGSFSTLFAAMLGYREIKIFGIDLNQIECIPEAKNISKNILVISKTPEHNPNYFFDDYQRKGEKFNIPNSKPNLHYKSWVAVKKRLEKFGVNVFNLNKKSRLDIFHFKEEWIYKKVETGVNSSHQEFLLNTTKKESKLYIVMMPHKDYHAETMYNISLELEKRNIKTSFLEPCLKHRSSGAIEALCKYKISCIPHDDFIDKNMMPNAVLVMNDWDMTSAHLIEYCKQRNICIIGLQEGICDFQRVNWKNSLYQQKNRLPYRKCDFLLLSSFFDTRYFKDKKFAVVGMDRVESLFHEKVSFPKKPMVLININFSYNVCVEFSRQWLEDVVDACKKSKFDFIISRHPQDETDVKGYESYISDRKLHDLIKDSSLFVSRFSNAIYESLILGKPVIYYNFHMEGSKNFNETEGAFSVAYNKTELIEYLKYEIQQREIRKRAKSYLESHISIKDGENSAQRAANGIEEYLLNIYRKKNQKRDIEKANISIVVPVYNVEKYIGDCLKSLLVQTIEKIEVICVDDASTDNSVKLIEEYMANDKRIKLYKLKKSRGPSGARNYALKYVKGIFVLFVDSDDWIKPETCKDLFFKIKKENSDVVLFNYYNYIEKSVEEVKDENIDKIIKGDLCRSELMRVCSPCTKIYRTEFLKRNGIHFPEGLIYEDWFWTLQWSQKAKKISAIDKAYYFYRRKRPGSITSETRDELKGLKSIILNMELSRKYLLKNNLSLEPYYVLVNKSDARIRNNVPKKEKETHLKILYKYLHKIFPIELPKEIVSPSIINLYKN